MVWAGHTSADIGKLCVSSRGQRGNPGAQSPVREFTGSFGNGYPMKPYSCSAQNQLHVSCGITVHCIVKLVNRLARIEEKSALCTA